MHNRRADLNFLFVLEALLDEGGVSAAADRLGLSQPAMSHALARLRKRFGDPLFVKTRAGMRPTPTAERIGLVSRQILTLVRDEILEVGAFDPATTTRTFTLGLSDMVATVLLGQITERFASSAPLARLRVVNVREKDIAPQLEEGLVDLVVGTYAVKSPSVMQQGLFKATEYVCIVRTGHPGIRESLSLEQFARIPHVVATQNAEANDFVDKSLRSKGLNRRVAVEVPSLLSLPKVVASTDYVALVPGALATLSQKITSLRVLEPPIKPPAPVIKQYWHQRFKADTSVTWLRNMLLGLWRSNGASRDRKRGHEQEPTQPRARPRQRNT
ncbi:MAG TPA: LysR family transcriptional regulator [Ramlibacter sp.]|nr:LysR family transcriptional regulator [Ramlibacter sp.]